MKMATKKNTRTTASLRDLLFDEIDALRGEDGDPKRAAAVAKLSQQIIGTAKLELEFQNTISRLNAAEQPAKIAPLVLGTN